MSKNTTSPLETPMIKHYLEMKRKHPDAILLYRVGDFYETFCDDAKEAHAILGITLTSRAGNPLAGFPYHAIDTYLPKLVRAGRRVAICEQLEDPKLTKKMVKRGITELVTPGLTQSDTILNARENNFLAAVAAGEGGTCGLALLDISTGEFMASEGSIGQIDKLVSGYAPKEMLYERGRKQWYQDNFSLVPFCYELDDYCFQPDSARHLLVAHFHTQNLKGFGLEELPAAIAAAGAILRYLDSTQHTAKGHITSLKRIDNAAYMRLDRFTIRSLELVGTMNEGGRSLLDVIDHTTTPMGSRMLRRWLLFPLTDVGSIRHRHDAVDHFFRAPALADAVEENLRRIGDVERIVGRAAVGRATPRDVVQLRHALLAMKNIKAACADATDDQLRLLSQQINPCDTIAERILREIEPEPPLQVARGGVIRSGVSAELDDLRHLAYSSKDYLLQMQQRLAEENGIPSLKVAFNNVFGYYIEVRNTHRDKVPPEWVRKQTLVGAERYITDELKEYEEKILGAEEKILALEQQLYTALLKALEDYIQVLQLDAQLVAQLDCLLSFARTAADYGYVRPDIDDSLVVDIRQGRHPVIERQMPVGEVYVANDVRLDNDTQQIMMITGPNMAGKSALLRQTALIVIMAHIGSFVPAEAARIGMVDKVFTRVGASDNISLGESTFMVEMTEAASILNNLSPRSLILFDELGRGTSTYDGISIAWAIVEHIHERAEGHPKMLFATHYHELNDMADTLQRIKNYNVSVREEGGRVLFLRKLKPGGSEHSFGIHVARLAGMTPEVVNRADEVLASLERQAQAGGTKAVVAPSTQAADGYQLSIFQLDDPVLSQVRDEIASLDIDHMTPMEALNKLHDIKRICGI